jgi:hypothetical protein
MPILFFGSRLLVGEQLHNFLRTVSYYLRKSSHISRAVVWTTLLKAQGDINPLKSRRIAPKDHTPSERPWLIAETQQCIELSTGPESGVLIKLKPVD